MACYDDILSLTGGFGYHQWKIYILAIFSTIAHMFFKIGNVVILAIPNHRCMLPYEMDNASYYLNDTEMSRWYSYDNNTSEYSTCTILPDNDKCTKFVFDGDQFGKTAVIQYGLVCDKEYLTATANSISMFGFMIGSFIFGSASDRWGRKPTFILCATNYLILGLVIAFSSNIWMFLVIKALLGTVTSGLWHTCYVLLMESVVPSKRILVSSFAIIFVPLSFVLISLYGFLSPNWQYLQAAFTFTGLPFLLYFGFVPESARWLLSKKKISQAKEVIFQIAKENKAFVQEENLEMLLSEMPSEKKHKDASIIDALRYPVLRLRMLNLLFVSMISFMIVFGVSWSAGKLKGNLYINVMLMGLMDVPSIVLVLYAGQKIGRRTLLSGYLALSSACFLTSTCWLSDHVWVLIWTLLGKLFICATFHVTMVYSTEIYPTVLRNAGLGLNAIFGSIGGIIAPYIFYLDTYWRPLPVIISAALLLAAACTSLLLPETFKKKLPETLEEGEYFGNNKFFEREKILEEKKLSSELLS